MDDKTFRQLRGKLETECGIIIKSLNSLDTGGSNSLTQIALTLDGEKYIVKLMRVGSYYDDYVNTLYALNELSDVVPRCVKCFLFRPEVLCIVTEWIEGTEVDYRCTNIKELDNTAIELAKCLKKLHTFPVKDSGREYSIVNDICSSKDTLIKYNIELPHKEIYLKYLDNIENIPCVDGRRGYIHFDLHTKNIIKCGISDYRFIDWEITGISDVWRDLVYAVCINHPDEQDFWLLFILNYFNDDIPVEFFSVVKFYVILFMMMLVKSNYIKGTLRNHFMLVEKVFYEYSTLKCNIPLWMKSTAEKLLVADTRHNNQLMKLIRLIEEERSVNENSNT